MQLRTAISICVSSPTVTITSDHLRVSVQEQVDVTHYTTAPIHQLTVSR